MSSGGLTSYQRFTHGRMRAYVSDQHAVIRRCRIESSCAKGNGTHCPHEDMVRRILEVVS